MEVKIIRVPIISKRGDVNKFLEELRSAFCDPSFNIDDDLILIISSKDPKHKQFSTPYTLNDLEYSRYDVAKCLEELTVQEYSETLFDRDDDRPPLLFVFGKATNNQQVYIKLKLKATNKKRVLCISFHYAEHEMEFPYR